MRLLGLPIDAPQALAGRVVADVAAVARFARVAPAQLERLVQIGEEIAEIGHQVLEVFERLDRRASDLLELSGRFDERSAEIAERGDRLADSIDELIGVLPAFERAVAMATPLEGAIDRFGRLVDRLPGGATRRRADEDEAASPPSAD